MDGVLGGPLSSAFPLDNYLWMALQGAHLPICARAMAGVHLSQYIHLERGHLLLSQALSDAFPVLEKRKRSLQGAVFLSQR